MTETASNETQNLRTALYQLVDAASTAVVSGRNRIHMRSKFIDYLQSVIDNTNNVLSAGEGNEVSMSLARQNTVKELHTIFAELPVEVKDQLNAESLQ